MRKLLYSIGVPVLLLFSFASFAQDKVITGRVTDSIGNGVANVSVTVKEAPSRGTTTSADGRFSISVPGNATTLVFSSVGYAYREIPISGNTVNVSLQSITSDLNTVVVIGYGTTRKKDLTGSVATINAKDFQKGTITTPEQLIAGKIAGVSIISNGGQPGSGSTIRIRGGSSLNASNDPLIVIDGVPLANGGIEGGNNPLSFINPNDIESFTVLKDASAAAIYGARAANGVIIITTKKGRSGKLRVNFTSTNSISEITDQVEVLTGNQVRKIVNDLGTATQKAQLGSANTNWQDQVYQTAFASDNNISFTGGLSNVPYRISVGYLNQTGVLKTDKLERNSAAIVLNPVLFDNHLKIDINLKGTIEKIRFGNTGAIGTAVYFDPTQPVKLKGSKRFNGYYEWLDASGVPNLNAARNPLNQLYDYNNNGNARRSFGNIQFDYKFHFLPDLHANLNLGYDIAKGTRTIFVSDSSSLEYTSGGEKNRRKERKLNTLLEFYLNYVKDLKAIKSRIDAVAGYSYNNYQTTNYFFASYNAKGVKFAGSDPAFPFDKPENTLLSYFGRVNYAYNEKYLLTATIRRDGSSRFSTKHRWGLFPSAAFAWKIKDEGFVKNSRTISDLKLRMGYGVTGQQEGIGNYDYLVYYNLSNPAASYQFGNTFYSMYKPLGFDPDRKWEETATYNIALDYGFMDNRITGSVDFYLKKTKDLLNTIPVPAATNFAAFITKNVGSMENKGVEFNINVQPIRNRQTTWDVSFNATYNKNTITKLNIVDNPYYAGFPTQNVSGAQGFAFINAVGTSKNTYFLYRQVYDKAGKPIEGLLEDLNRDGIINEGDKYKGKRADPNLFLGLSSNFSYQKWNAGFVTRASFNNYVYNNLYSNNGKLNQILGSYTTGNASVNYLETQFTGNTVNRNAQILSDYYLQNGSFLKMDNAFVGYNFGKIAHDKASLRVNLSVQNVFTITKYTGLDPEISWGVDNNLYPRPRIYSLGLNLDF